MKTSLFIKTLLEKKLILPPLSGFTDFPYRLILSDFSPPFITTEMVKTRAVIEHNDKTLSMLRKENGPHLKGAQILGSDPVIMAKAAQKIQDIGFDFVDINMGCTVKKVTSKGEGISLMKDEGHASAIVKAVSNAVSIPVTAKLRTGFSVDSINVLSLSEKLASNGAKAITIHGRTGEKKFCQKVDMDIIREATKLLTIPVIANGGIFSADDAVKMLEYTSASAVMPGRGILGNPWLITEITNAFENKPYKPPSLKEKKEICKKHLGYICEYYGERTGILKMRKITPWYFSTCRNIKYLRRDVQEAKTIDNINKLLDKIIEENNTSIYK
ncbi:MAG: tRNA dihydrouridine synthase DusB [Candidatus Aureabacteria bacterium]|nr:tRNA dihydrouridine synthase DusB [Candidatus Auribacterota bacterium]